MAVWLLSLYHKNHCNFLLVLSQIAHSRRSHQPCHEHIQAALQRALRGEVLRPPGKSQKSENLLGNGESKRQSLSMTRAPASVWDAASGGTVRQNGTHLRCFWIPDLQEVWGKKCLLFKAPWSWANLLSSKGWPVWLLCWKIKLEHFPTLWMVKGTQKLSISWEFHRSHPQIHLLHKRLCCFVVVFFLNFWSRPLIDFRFISPYFGFWLFDSSSIILKIIFGLFIFSFF